MGHQLCQETQASLSWLLFSRPLSESFEWQRRPFTQFKLNENWRYKTYQCSNESSSQIILPILLHIFCVMEFDPAVVCLIIRTLFERETYNGTSTGNSIVNFHHIIRSPRRDASIILAIICSQTDLHLSHCQARDQRNQIHWTYCNPIHIRPPELNAHIRRFISLYCSLS
jgi:hypothetical protein